MKQWKLFSNSRRPLLAVLLCFLSLPVFSQTHTARTANINTNCKGYYEYLPVNYTPSTGKFPLILYCGGAGSFGNGSVSQLSRLLPEGIPYYINNNQFPSSFTVNGETSSFIVISPQFVAWPAPGDVEAVLNYIINSGYKVDQSRIYLTGFSAGGDVSWKYPNTGLARAKRLAALVPISGYNYPYVDSGAHFIAEGNLPVWALHSNDDQSAPVSWSQNFVNKINSYNPQKPAIITRVNGPSHDGSKTYFTNPTFKSGGYNIYEWMLLNRRNYPPVANAGNNISVTLPVNSTPLDGSNSYDPENGPLTFSWTKISGPSQYSINNTAIATPVVSNLVAGNYSFELLVTDTSTLTGRDTVTVTVINPNPNILPVARAGADQQINLPQNAVVLNGTASNDPDGIIESYAWTKISGPSQYSLSGAGSSTASVSNLRAGTYSFQLAVTDNENGVGKDTIQITVINPFPNQPPTANAGADQVITLPVNSVTLSGAASSDPDGEIISYLWSQASGPSSALIATPSAVSSAFQNLIEGTYRFVLRVMDDSSAIARDTVAILVQPAPVVTSKFIKVNLYGGSNAYNQGGWNNWNITGSTNISSSNFNYSDGTTSTVHAVLSYSQGASDNGASYGGTMCPPEVLRYTTYSTASTRTVTLSGLNSAFNYDLELYASRANTGNTTVFVINGISQSVVTDNNKTNKVVFTNLAPTAGGQLVININKSGTFTYLNGFTLTERNGAPPPPNQLPIANAGPDQTIILPANSVTLSGAGSSDPDGVISSWLWTKVGGPASYNIANANNVSTAVNNLVAGNYLFELIVTDNSGGIARDTVQVIVNNSSAPPGPGDSLNCGKVFTIVVLGSSTAYGTGATPIDSSWVNKYLAYIRTKHPLNAIVNLATLSLTTYEVLCPNDYVPPANRPAPDPNRNITKALSFNPDAIIINLPTNDIAMGYTQQESKDNYERTMALADAANIPVWVTTTQPRNTLSPQERQYLMEFRDWTYQRFGSKAIDFWTDVANADGTINTNYSYGDGVHVNNNGHNLFYQRVVSEKLLDSLCIRKNVPPNANAGADQSVTLPVNSVNLNGSASIDPDGTIASYLWSRISGPAQYQLSSSTAISPVFSNLVSGTYQLELLVTDNLGASDRDTVIITVNPAPNQPPTANAGPDIIITLPLNSTVLNGSGTDPDGTISSYAWTWISGPAPGTLTNANTTNATAGGLIAGVYSYQLTVTDNQGATGKDTVNVTVNPAVNQPPTANAGPDIQITLPVNSTALNGNGNDPDGTITGYAWTKISGPASGTLTNANTANATAGGLVAGVYSYQLTVTDNQGATGKDTVNVAVSPAVNQLPTANAGPDILITLPVNSTALNGSGNDPDGTITAYAWVKISGPSAGTLSNANTANATASGLAAGIYSYQLTVTDNQGGTGKDTVLVTVNQAPVANAGADILITLPVNSTILSGSGTDPDGSISSYAWAKISGPSAGTLSNANAANATAAGLVEGVYSYQLTVTDNRGATGKDTVLVTVNPQPPGGEKYIKVNLYGGTNPYNQVEWNNWNLTGSTNISSPLFKYSDATNSTVNAVLSYSQGVPDNGASYGGTMCPPEVLRYPSYSTSNRTLTLSGLNNTYYYDIEFYASRGTTGNSTQFTINGVSQSVVTDNNKSNKVVFTNLSASASGQLSIAIARIGTFNYLNGFILTERSGAAPLNRVLVQPEWVNTPAIGTDVQMSMENRQEITESGALTVTARPSISANDFSLFISSSNSQPVIIRILDITGRQVVLAKTAGNSVYHCQAALWVPGIYFAELSQGNYRQMIKLVKLNSR